ncbi:MAG: DUF177 domain-containing protein [Gammaproteobacteria bacterium]|nr:MAG: DUF177 domain-containing protein [Gammaproteobacteria bacterium]
MLLAQIGIPQLRDMAKRSEEIADEIGLTELSRLASMQHPNGHNRKIDVRIRFRGGAQGFPEISGTISGLLELTCQRCLGALDWPLELDFQLAVVESEEDIEEVAEPFDTLMAGKHGVVFAEFIEDEVLSSLPLAPVHADVADCADAELLKTKIVHKKAGVRKAPDGEAMGEMNQPFAELAAMLKHDADTEDTDN